LFEISGSFYSQHKTNIFILQQVRNCIVHNDAVVDKKFQNNCNWLGYKIGERITITKEDYLAYEFSVLTYIQEVFYRLNKILGAPQNYLESLRSQLDNLFYSKNSDNLTPREP